MSTLYKYSEANTMKEYIQHERCISGVQMILHSKAVFLLPIRVRQPFQKYDQISMLVQQINSQKVCLFWFFRASLVSTSPLGGIQKGVTNANPYPKEFIKYISY